MKKVMKWCVCILGLGLALESAQAASRVGPPPSDGPAQTVVLLSSVDTSQMHLPGYLFFMRHYFRTYERGLESVFRSYFTARGYRVEIHALADQHDLWVALHSPNNVGVFWLSHAAFSGLTGPGLGAGGEIADARGFDITDAFQDIHPNLRFLGVVGCKSQPVILQQLENHGVKQQDPELQVSAFDRKVDAKKGLKMMMAIGERALSAPAVEAGYESSCPVRKGYELQVTRKLPVPANPSARVLFPSIRVELGSGEVLGIFPAGKAGETQSLTVHLDAQTPGAPADAFALKLIEDSGANAVATRDLVQIGELEFSEPWAGAQWTPFASPAGELIGVTSHVYRYTGPAELSAVPADYSPFACEPMPALHQK